LPPISFRFPTAKSCMPRTIEGHLVGLNQTRRARLSETSSPTRQLVPAGVTIGGSGVAYLLGFLVSAESLQTLAHIFEKHGAADERIQVEALERHASAAPVDDIEDGEQGAIEIVDGVVP